ncbi:uncharacterized protein LOC115688440 [Syzygium oleosum]|uniref:uncharacterized protein LOC115688440 n=1 Tax=Syzygium oleosum TaxID=219896 RepID=UPI0011D2B63B|nr:uncharacterized protein LOC115688440 [Syzygium oleosum]
MVTTNPLASILDKNCLTGSNFTDWVRNLRIVLNSEKIGYVLDQKMPDSFPEGGTQDERVTYDKWCDDDLKVRSYMLALMNNELQKKYETMEDARYEISKALYRMRMAEGSSVNDHALKMIWHIEELARFNLIMDNELAVDLIL